MPRNVESLTDQSQNEFEQASLQEMIPVGVERLPTKCILDIQPNKQIIHRMQVQDRQIFTRDFFADQTLFTVPSRPTLLTGIEHCRKIHRQLQSPVWINDIPHFYMAQKAPWLTGHFFEEWYRARKWAEKHNESIGLLSAEDQSDETVGSNALIEEQCRVSPQLATIVLDKNITWRWLRKQWRGEKTMLNLIDDAFGKCKPSSQLVTSFQLESVPRRLYNIHPHAQEYSSQATRHHIAEGAYGIVLELMQNSDHVKEACYSARLKTEQVQRAFARLVAYTHVSPREFNRVQRYLHGIAAQQIRAIERINASEFTDVKVTHADMFASRNTTTMFTFTDAGDSIMHTLDLSVDLEYSSTICLNAVSDTLITYYELLFETGILQGMNSDDFRSECSSGQIRRSIISMI